MQKRRLGKGGKKPGQRKISFVKRSDCSLSEKPIEEAENDMEPQSDNETVQNLASGSMDTIHKGNLKEILYYNLADIISGRTEISSHNSSPTIVICFFKSQFPKDLRHGWVHFNIRGCKVIIGWYIAKN